MQVHRAQLELNTYYYYCCTSRRSQNLLLQSSAEKGITIKITTHSLPSAFGALGGSRSARPWAGIVPTSSFLLIASPFSPLPFLLFAPLLLFLPCLTTSPLPLLFEKFLKCFDNLTILLHPPTLYNRTAPHTWFFHRWTSRPHSSLARFLFSSLPLLCFHPVYSLSRSPGLPAPGLRHPCSPSWAPVRDPNLVNHVWRFPNLQPVSPIRTLGDGTEPGPSPVNQARRAAEAGAEPEPILRSATACASTMPCHAFPTCPLSVCGVRCCK